VGTIKRTRGDNFFLPCTEETTKKIILKDVHSLVSYFTMFVLDEKFKAC
jgi:hypothetical protein